MSSVQSLVNDNGSAAIQVVLREREARDRGWWEDMRDCFAGDSRVTLSWYDGSGKGFVDGSIEMSRGQRPTRHRISAPVVRISESEERAVISLSLAIEMLVSIEDTDCVLSTYARHLYRLQKLAEWKIVKLDAIYERSELMPEIPGQVVRIDPAELEGLRVPYRLLAWNLRRTGHEASQDLPADDRPDQVAELYSAAFAWAGISHP